MSIFDRKKPLKTIKKYMERFFTKKDSERIDFVDTTLPVQVEVTDVGEPGSGGWNDSDLGGDNPDNDNIITTQSLIEDEDGDTKVDTEESTDEDKIRFDTGGSERFRMEANDTDGGALYIKEGAGTTAPSTPSSGEGVIYEKNDGKLYFKNDAGTEYELTATGGGSYKWILKGDSGSNQDIDNEYIGWVKGGTGITTTVASEIAADPTRSVTIDCDLEGTELKSTGETGGTKFLREDGDGTCSWQTPAGGGSMSSFTLTGDSGSNQTVTDGNTVDIEGGTGINTVVGATDKVTVNCDLEGTELKSTGETGGNKFLREDGDGTCSWQTGLGGGTVQGTDHVRDIQATNQGAIAGNARGEYSVDLQTERNNATEVASGTNSTLIAGENNTASGIGSGVIAGNTNVASGTRAFVGGGNNNTASGSSACAFGSNNTADGNQSIAIGTLAKTKRYGTLAVGGGDGSTFTVGEAQCGTAVWSGRTTNNTATELFLGNLGTNRFTLDTDSAVTLEIWASVVDEAAPSTYNAGYSFIGTVVNDSGTTAIGGAGSITKTSNPTAAFALGGGDLNVTADNTNDSIKVTATGLTGRNIRWVVSMRYTEVVV